MEKTDDQKKMDELRQARKAKDENRYESGRIGA